MDCALNVPFLVVELVVKVPFLVVEPVLKMLFLVVELLLKILRRIAETIIATILYIFQRLCISEEYEARTGEGRTDGAQAAVFHRLTDFLFYIRRIERINCDSECHTF